jgi:hypothetical protein
MTATAIAAIWNGILVTIAVLAALAGWYDVTVAILGSMMASAILAGLAAQAAEAIAEAIPFVTAFVGTLTTVFYWVFKIQYWLS